MKVSATQKHARMSPRKLRPYARMITGMSAVDAQNQLAFSIGKAPVIILDVLKSAVANATHNLKIPVSDLKIESIFINQGLVLKRFMPVSKGMAHSILKRTAHVTVTVEGELGEKVKKATAKKVEQIETVSTEDFVALEEKDKKKEERELAKENKKGAQEDRTAEVLPDKKMTTFQKMKMNQQGGDAKKAHRRKSIG